MTWARVDDTLHAHRKVRRAGLEAMGLWVVALSYCAQHKTGGAIVLEDVVHLAGSTKRAQKLAGALVDAGMWEVTATGYQFHDWDEYQYSRDFLDAQRERGRRGGQARAAAKATDRHSDRYTDRQAIATKALQPDGLSRPAQASDPYHTNPIRSDRAHALGPEPETPPPRARDPEAIPVPEAAHSNGAAAAHAAKLADLARIFTPKVIT